MKRHEILKRLEDAYLEVRLDRIDIFERQLQKARENIEMHKENFTWHTSMDVSKHADISAGAVVRDSGVLVSAWAHTPSNFCSEQMEQARTAIEQAWQSDREELLRMTVEYYGSYPEEPTLDNVDTIDKFRRIVAMCHPDRSAVITSPETAQETPIPVEDDNVFSPRPEYAPVEVSNETTSA